MVGRRPGRSAARIKSQSGMRDLRIKPGFYRLRDEPHATILVTCSKLDWRAAFNRDDLIASHGPEHLLTRCRRRRPPRRR